MSDLEPLLVWLAEYGYALSVDLYVDDGTTDPGVWVAVALEPGGWGDEDDATHRGPPAPTPAEALAGLWRVLREGGRCEGGHE